MSDRDPRNDPKGGDVLTKGGELVEVGQAGEVWVSAVVRSAKGVSAQLRTVGDWRRWAADATVIHKGEEL